MKFNHVLIDLDILTYRCGFAIETKNKETGEIEVEPVHHAYYNINSTMDWIFERTKADSYTGYLTASGRGNFRFNVFPDYKANRKDARKPFYYNEIREYLIKKYEAVIVEGQEADDSISIEQYKRNSLGFDYDIRNSIIVSIDKDFNNVPGWHLNYVKDEIYYVTEIEALRNFYLQILTGDTADGIPRIKKGWREKEAKAALEKATTEEEMYKIVLKEIKLNTNEWKHQADDLLVQRARLVHLRSFEGEMWTPEFINRMEK